MGESATSHWGERRGGLIKFKLLGVSMALFYRAPPLFDKGRGRIRSQSSWGELVPLCEPDKGCGQLPWHFSYGYESFERYKCSLPERCVQRGLNRGTSRRPPSLCNRLEGFQLGKCNLHRRNIHLSRLWITWTRLSWVRHQIWHSLHPMTLEVGRFSLACWGWMSRSGVGVLERIHGRFNAPNMCIYWKTWCFLRSEGN